METNACDFCLDEVFMKQGVHENESIRVIYPLNPVIFGHLMIMPKRHLMFFTDLNDKELVGVKKAISKMYEIFKSNNKIDGFNIMNNNGTSAGQHVSHTHIHLFMRKEGDLSPFDILSKKIVREKFSESEWNQRLATLKHWIDLSR